MTAQLDPQAQALLDAMKASGAPPVHTLPIGDARKARRAQLVVDPPRVQVASAEDERLPGPCGGTPIRWYRPSGETGLPVTLYFHGGGWTVDDLDTHDHLCRRLATRSHSIVVSVGYRQGPAHRYPAAVEDAYAATQWVSAVATDRGADPTRLAVAGDSAGGNLGTAVALLCRDRRGPVLRFQALAYPVTDHWQVGTRSYRQRGDGYTLTREFVRWSFEQYLPPWLNSADPSHTGLADPYLFPLCAPDLSGLPPAFVFTAEFDPLRDEGRAYAQRLQGAGVAVEHVHLPDQMHGFLLQELMIDRAREAVDQFADAIRLALA